MLRVEFMGALRGDSLADAYAHMDIFASPSDTETVGNVVLEAMASGIPAVVMGSGRQKPLVDAQTAIVADTSAAFVQGVRTLVKNRRRREAMGIASRARAVGLLSWDRIFAEMCHAYDAAITAAESGRGEIGTPGVLRAS
jgi:glycosyltransferase involved in cell wall biosynthesis